MGGIASARPAELLEEQRDCRAKLTVERKLGKVYERALKRLGSSGEKYKKRLFGRRSEKKQGEGSGRGPGQQPGSKGHGRTPRELEEKEEHHDPAPEDRKCPCCGEPYVRNGHHKSHRIEVVIKVIRRVILRGRWRKTCSCAFEIDQDEDRGEASGGDDRVPSGSSGTSGLDEEGDTTSSGSSGEGSGSEAGNADTGELSGSEVQPGDEGSADGGENTGPEGCDSDEEADHSASSGSADATCLDENDDQVPSPSSGAGSGSTEGSVDNGEATGSGSSSSSGESDGFAASTGGSGSEGDDGRSACATSEDSSDSADESADGGENTGPEGCDSDDGAGHSASSGSAGTASLDEKDDQAPSPSFGMDSGSTGGKVDDGGTTGTGAPAFGGETDSSAPSGSNGSKGKGYQAPSPHLRNAAAVEVYVPPVDSLFRNTLFGISVWSQFLYAHYCSRLSLQETARWFGDNGIPMSAGTLGDSIPRFIPLFAPLIEAIAARQNEAWIRYGDETSWRIQELHEQKGNGRAWVWIGLSDDTTLFKISPSRSAVAAADLFGKAPPGTIIVCDRYAAYKKLAKDCDFILAFCWAHVRRDFLECALSDESLEDWRQGWVDRIGTIFALNKLRCAAVNQGLPSTSEQLALEEAVDALFDTAKEELDEIDEVDLRRKPLQSLLNHREGLTVFVDNHEVELSNNRSERFLRCMVLIRKISFGSFSMRGAAFTAMMLSVISTLERNGVAIKPWLDSWLQACADNGRKPPDDLTPWLPWKNGDRKPP